MSDRPTGSNETQPGATAVSVSVVVPSYNHAAFIETTLRSIAKQTLAPAELIVIDDGSTDNSRSVIDRALADCTFPCEVIARENRGLCATLNEGLDRSNGKYFAYLGSDDVWLPDFLKARTELLAFRPRAALAYGHAFFIDETNRVIDCTSDWAKYVDGDVCEMLLETIAPMSPTVVYRRAALLNHAWNPQARLEDYEMYLHLCTEGEFAFDERVLSAWRRHQSNTSWDQQFMLEEQLKAQREAAVRFGMDEAAIEKLQKVTRFARAEDFMRVGEKSRALSLMLANLGGASSFSATGRMLVRLLTPYALIERRRARRQKEATKRYGVLQV